jgi:translation initiation factor IF-1
MSVTVEFENDRVRVTRVRHDKHERRPHIARGDRLVVYLDDGEVVREEGGKTETIRHKRGDVVWRAQSTHRIANALDAPHEALIVELK